MNLLLAAIFPAAACDAPPAAEAFATLVAESAHDPDAARRARDALPCVDVALSTIDAALYHRAMAADAWSRRSDAEALAEMRAARAAAPDWHPPANLRPLWDRALPDPAAPSVAWEGLVDGAAGKLYLDRAALLQRFTKGAWETRYVLPLSGAEAALPPGPDRSLRALPPATLHAWPAPARGAFYTGVGLSAAGIAAFGLAVAWNAEFKDLDNPNVANTEELADLGNRTNAATVTAWVFSTAGVVCVGAALVQVKFQ